MEGSGLDELDDVDPGSCGGSRLGVEDARTGGGQCRDGSSSDDCVGVEEADDVPVRCCGGLGRSHASSRTSRGSCACLVFAGCSEAGDEPTRLRSWLRCDRSILLSSTHTLYITLPIDSTMTPGAHFQLLAACTLAYTASPGLKDLRFAASVTSAVGDGTGGGRRSSRQVRIRRPNISSDGDFPSGAELFGVLR